MKNCKPEIVKTCAIAAALGIARICIWNHECGHCGFAQWVDDEPGGFDDVGKTVHRFEELAVAA